MSRKRKSFDKSRKLLFIPSSDGFGIKPNRCFQPAARQADLLVSDLFVKRGVDRIKILAVHLVRRQP